MAETGAVAIFHSHAQSGGLAPSGPGPDAARPSFSAASSVGSAGASNSSSINAATPPPFPLTPAQALKHYGHLLTPYEQGEILEFKRIYYLGGGGRFTPALPPASKAAGSASTRSPNNHGFDDARGVYVKLVPGDHLLYRYEIVELLGEGSFGQVVKCFDHASSEVVAVKLVRNKKRFTKQAGIELALLAAVRDAELAERQERQSSHLSNGPRESGVDGAAVAAAVAAANSGDAGSSQNNANAAALRRHLTKDSSTNTATGPAANANPAATIVRASSPHARATPTSTDTGGGSPAPGNGAGNANGFIRQTSTASSTTSAGEQQLQQRLPVPQQQRPPATAAAPVDHHIIHVRDSFTFRGHLCFTFPLLSLNLYELIKKNHFKGVSLSLIRRFAGQIVDALAFIAALNIVHADLKPENILLRAPNKSSIALIDFGSSCYEDQRVYTYIQR